MRGAWKDFCDECCMRASVETNCPQGGNYPGKTLVGIEALFCTSLYVEVTDIDGRVFECDAEKVRLRFEGDNEARLLRKMLAWAALQLDELTDNKLLED